MSSGNSAQARLYCQRAGIYIYSTKEEDKKMASLSVVF